MTVKSSAVSEGRALRRAGKSQENRNVGSRGSLACPGPEACGR